MLPGTVLSHSSHTGPSPLSPGAHCSWGFPAASFLFSRFRSSAQERPPPSMLSRLPSRPPTARPQDPTAGNLSSPLLRAMVPPTLCHLHRKLTASWHFTLADLFIVCFTNKLHILAVTDLVLLGVLFPGYRIRSGVQYPRMPVLQTREEVHKPSLPCSLPYRLGIQ